ncbi:MAG: DNA translocase FtsK [Clostridiales bacterium]|jgi:S-DNA-T family DNA segregation ATPase FtsK/SpoIIIE|nr:DNA translocase FtsK [Clostridiales bacterium]
MNKIITRNNKANFSAALITALIASIFILVGLIGLMPDAFDIINDFFFGVFGLAAFAYCVFIILVSSALLAGYKIVVKKLTLINFGLFFFVFLMLLHTATAGSSFGGASFSEFCTMTFNNANTAGGLIFSVLAYPLLALLGAPSAIAVYAILLFGLLVLLFFPYLMVSKRKATQNANPSLTEVKDGSITPRIVETSPKRKPAIFNVRTKPTGENLHRKQSRYGGFDPGYPNKDVENPDGAERRQNAVAVLYENSDKKMVVDKSMPTDSEIITVSKKENLFAEIKEDISDYTNNGRLKTLQENSKHLQSAGEGTGGGIYYRPNAASEEVEDKSFSFAVRNDDADSATNPVEAQYSKFEEKTVDPVKSETVSQNEEKPKVAPSFDYSGYTMRSGTDYGERRPSMLGNDLSAVKEQLRLEAEKEKAEREADEKRRIEEEAERRDAGYRSSKQKTFGFFDDYAGEEKEFVNVRDKQRKKEEKPKSEVEVSGASSASFDADNAESVYDSILRPEPDSPIEKLTETPPPITKPETEFKLNLSTTDKTIKKPSEQITFDVVKPINHAPYNAPPIDLLLEYTNENVGDFMELTKNAKKLEELFADFKISATSCGVLMGPTFTRYEMQMPPGVSVNRVLTLDNDISMRLLSPKRVRIEAPIPEKDAFGIEVPNKNRSTVGMRDLINDAEFYDANGKLTFTIGKDIAGKNYYGDLADMPHLLIAGSTGSGKSCCLNSLIISLLYKYEPDEVKLILIDPKQVELTMYEGLPHLLLHDIITEDEKVINALDWAIKEMHRRYGLIRENRSNNIMEYNKKVAKNQRLYRVVIVVDEVAELIIKLKRDIEDRIKSLSQLARAAGIHIVLATQRPSVDIITGVIKSNLPSRIAFAVTSNVDSRTILDRQGAEKLLGKGDMLFQAQAMPEPVRLQGVFISNQEIVKVVDYVKQNNEAYYDQAIDAEINTVKEEQREPTAADRGDESLLDPLFVKAVKLVVENKAASISMLQRKFAIGYARAARIIDSMEEKDIIGKGEGAKPRTVLLTEDQFDTIYGDSLEGNE